MERKICNKCKESLPLTMFGKLSITKDGLNYSCKECRTEYEIKRKSLQPKRKRLLINKRVKCFTTLPDNMKFNGNLTKRQANNALFVDEFMQCGEGYQKDYFL